MLGEQQARERRVGNLVHRHGGQPLRGEGRVVLQVAVAERRRPASRLERGARTGQVDRREVEQEPEALGQVRQLAVDGEVVRRQRASRAAARQASSPSSTGTDASKAAVSSSRCRRPAPRSTRP